MGVINDWHDGWRLINALICAATLVGLITHFINYHHDWNSTARDLWYALSLCMFAGIGISVEAIVLDEDLGVRTPLIFFAALAAFKAVVDRDHWRPRQ